MVKNINFALGEFAKSYVANSGYVSIVDAKTGKEISHLVIEGDKIPSVRFTEKDLFPDAYTKGFSTIKFPGSV